MDDDSGLDYSLSISDLMSSLLFVFIIVLVAIILMVQKAQVKNNEVYKHLTGAKETRAKILNEIKDSLHLHQINVRIDTLNGVLILNDNVVKFDQSRAVLDYQSLQSLKILSKKITEVLPCYINSSQECSNKSLHQVESIFIEGHTDSIGSEISNWKLSTDRAIYAYSRMMEFEKEFENYENIRKQNVFSVAGYGESRPRYTGEDLSKMDENRRIDIRIIMEGYLNEK